MGPSAMTSTVTPKLGRLDVATDLVRAVPGQDHHAIHALRPKVIDPPVEERPAGHVEQRLGRYATREGSDPGAHPAGEHDDRVHVSR